MEINYFQFLTFGLLLILVTLIFLIFGLKKPSSNEITLFTGNFIISIAIALIFFITSIFIFNIEIRKIKNQLYYNLRLTDYQDKIDYSITKIDSITGERNYIQYSKDTCLNFN